VETLIMLGLDSERPSLAEIPGDILEAQNQGE